MQRRVGMAAIDVLAPIVARVSETVRDPFCEHGLTLIP